MIYNIRSTMIEGDPLAPRDTDVIAQLGLLRVGAPTPEDWRVLAGDGVESRVARVVYRFELIIVQQCRSIGCDLANTDRP